MKKRHYPYIKNWPGKLKVALMVFSIISFIILFLEPFKTDECQKLSVLGYSICILASYMIVLLCEYLYFAKSAKWSVQNELFVFLSLFVLSAGTVYWYDLVVIKGQVFGWSRFLPFTIKVVLPFGVIVVPLIAGLRHYIGQIHEPPNEYLITITGKNKSEAFEFDYRDILYVKSANNYVEVIFASKENQTKKELIRCTLSQVKAQLPKFVQSHRSFLINPSEIKALRGSQKKATIQLKSTEEEIPVSKSYFDLIRSMEKQWDHSPQTRAN